MWQNILKVDSVWDSNISDERLIYFIWNSFQINGNRTEKFYNDNYYTFHEVYNRLITDYPDELKRQGKDNTEWIQIRKDLMEYKDRVELFLKQMKRVYPWPIKTDLDNITKEQLLLTHKNIMEMRWNERALYDASKGGIKRDLDQVVKILSKRNPKLNYLWTGNIEEGHLETRPTEYLIDFKRWLATKVK
mgnify:CR=1 FL=1|jgi:hypothetical protein|tara:strand:+ start:338 stop:907 length:570 start_codon:yes stop_codon:yes gene_type:complete